MLCAARSANGFDNWEIDSKPTFMADPEHYADELWGIEDPRITTGSMAIGLSYSSDLRNWGSYKKILEARLGGWWGANKIGLSPPPSKRYRADW